MMDRNQEIYDRYHRLVYYVAKTRYNRYLRCSHVDVEDVVQEAFLRIYQALANGEDLDANRIVSLTAAAVLFFYRREVSRRERLTVTSNEELDMIAAHPDDADSLFRDMVSDIATYMKIPKSFILGVLENRRLNEVINLLDNPNNVMPMKHTVLCMARAYLTKGLAS